MQSALCATADFTPMTAPGQTRSFCDVGSMSGLPKADMCGRFMSTRLKSSLAVYATSGGLISYGPNFVDYFSVRADLLG